MNADYYGRQGLVIIKKRNIVTLSNPGNFRIEIEAAKSGGVSDPRNNTIFKMFNLIDIGERAGSGIPNIYRIWDKQGWKLPVIEEHYKPERITLLLPIEKIGLKPSRTRDYLNELIDNEIVVTEGGNRNREYRLKN